MGFSLLGSFLLALAAAGAEGAAKDLGVACVPDTDTCAHATLTLVCDTAARKCLAKVGQSCTDATTCVTGADCTGTSGSETCACGTGYTDSSPAGTCTIANDKAGGACTGSSTCGTGATCNAGTVCYCDVGYTVNLADGTCTVVTGNALGGACTYDSNVAKGSCTASNALCPQTGSFCACANGYRSSDGTTCTAVTGNALGGACTYDNNDAKGSCTASNAECPQTDSFCACAPNYISLDGTTCIPVAGKLGGACNGNSAGDTQGDCTTTNAVCSGMTGTCGCATGSTASGLDTCNIDADKLGGTCTGVAAGNTQGSCTTTNAVCSAASGICGCKTGYTASGLDTCSEQNSGVSVAASAVTIVLSAFFCTLFSLP